MSSHAFSSLDIVRWEFVAEADGAQLNMKGHDKDGRWMATVMVPMTPEDWQALASLAAVEDRDHTEPAPVCDHCGGAVEPDGSKYGMWRHQDPRHYYCAPNDDSNDHYAEVNGTDMVADSIRAGAQS